MCVLPTTLKRGRTDDDDALLVDAKRIQHLFSYTIPFNAVNIY